MPVVVNERHEEILEAIWTAAEAGEHHLEAVRRRCEVPFDAGDLAALERVEVLVRAGDTVALSAAGLTLAARVIRRHRLAEVLLGTALKLKPAHVDAIACTLEHTLLPEVEEAICTLLGHPEVGPGGQPIPPGACCRAHVNMVSTVVASLAELRAHDSGRVTYIKPETHAQLHQLIAIGLNPGVIVRVNCISPAFCIRFDNTELAIDREIARRVFVVRTDMRDVR
ncbi:MAG TPA: metal-dependent transcriptional regulator [Polyangia bacterium]|jgi:DtxR family Mn-dependent transcriptional regulator